MNVVLINMANDLSSYEDYCTILQDVTCNKNSKENVSRIYKDWAARYDKDLSTYGMPRGPQIIANKLAALLGNSRHVRVLDLGAGTGIVAEELKKQGFTDIDALDASPDMLRVAKSKGLYNRLICDYLGPNHLDIEDGIYDCLVVAGTFVPHHANDSCFEELIRICKPGGLTVFAVAQKNLVEPDFKGRFEPRILNLEESGAWKWLERNLHDNFTNFYTSSDDVPKRNARGVLYVLQKEE